MYEEFHIFLVFSKYNSFNYVVLIHRFSSAKEASQVILQFVLVFIVEILSFLPPPATPNL